LARPRLIVAVDVGTTKVLALAAAQEGDHLSLAASGVAPCAALRRGVVVDMEAAASAISQALAPLLSALGPRLPGAWVGVTGAHLASANLQGGVGVAAPEAGITRSEIDAALQQAGGSVPLPSDREVVHAIPRSFAIDGQDGVRNPLGMSARALEVSAHLVTGTTTLLDNLEQAVLRSGLMVEELVFEPIAAGHALLSAAEQDLGTLLVDIGGGTSDYALFADGAVCHSGSVPLGGGQVTRDLAMALGADPAEAERLKVEHGHCLYQELPEEDEVSYHPLGGGEEQVSRRYLAGIIEARMEEILRLVWAEAGKCEYASRLAGGLVLTGGSSRLPGIRTLAERITGRPARSSRGQGVEADPELLADPAWATGFGLLCYAAAQETAPQWQPRPRPWQWLLRVLRLGR